MLRKEERKHSTRLDRALTGLDVPASRDFLCLATRHIRQALIDLSRQYFGARGLGANQLPPGCVSEDVLERGQTARPDGPAELAQWTEFHSRIRDLPQEDRELFDLLYYQGLSQPEAAKELGIPLTTLKRRWQAARLRFAEAGGLPE
jgi:RNA polymerase sigma-70 factor (ECF subfamily)